ncbi:MAG TPA: VWA domain-containing protein [Pyrinomonadaceae bacterium]|nr:VWA domain-containing protein [Pyrinomonadaceae bacterium]
MKKYTALALAFAITLVFLPAANSQTRPRRVNPNPAPEQTAQPAQTQTTAPGPATSQMGKPPAPPVLRGANRDPNEQNPTAAQKPKDAGPEEVGEGDVVKVETTLVSIPVAVMDRDGKYIPDLTKHNFRIWEDDVEQKVAYFASTEKPFTVALVIDTSASTRYKVEEIQDAAIDFVNQLRPDDKVGVISFDDKIRGLDRQPTNDRATLRNWILQTRIGSGTRLYDAMDQVLNQYFNHIDGRKAIVLFTDGVDTTSKHASFQTTLQDAEESDALIYPVEYDTSADMGIWFPGGGGGGGGWPGGGSRRGGRNYPGGGGNYPNGSGGNYPNGTGGNYPNGNGGNYPNGNGGGNSPNSNGRNNPGNNRGGGSIIDILGAILNGGSYPGGYPGGGGRNGGGWPGTGTTRAEYEIADQYLHDLARVSGARLYDAEQTNLNVAFQSVAEELRRQYSLGYYPKNAPHAGERRNIRVRVNRPELVVRTRDSYIFQPGANQSAQSSTQQPAKAPVLKKDYSSTQWH